MSRSAWSFAGSVLVLFSMLAAASAQKPDDAADLKTTPLGVRQARVERMVEDLERKFNQLAQALAKAEPERAQKLADALKQAQALGIKGRMAAITRLLDQQQLDPAKAEESKILGDLKDLLDKGIVRAEGQGRNTVYRLTDEAPTSKSDGSA